MPGQNYYLVSALPTLGELGSPPPLTPGDLRQHLAPAHKAMEKVDVVLLADDLLQRESLLAGESKDAEPVILTPAQARNDEPLPPYLAAGDGAPEPPRIASDAVWAAYFRHAASAASRLSSPFLAAWVRYEVALRNALVAARAKVLGLDPGDYYVTPELGSAGEDFGALLAEWAAAANPLEGLRIIDRARWSWLVDRERWFSFTDDEIVAYAAKLMLLARWHRLSPR